MAQLRRAVALLAALAIVMLSASCDNFFVSENSTQSLTVSPTAVILKAAADASTPGDTTNLTATATTIGGTQNDVTSTASWSSSDNTLATVSAGAVTVVGTAGGSTATITASSGGKSATCKVLTFTGTAPGSLTVTANGVTANALTPSQQFQLTVTATFNSVDTDVTQYVTYSTNAASTVATVSSSGLVTVQSTATSGDNFTVTATGHMANNTTITGTSVGFSLP